MQKRSNSVQMKRLPTVLRTTNDLGRIYLANIRDDATVTPSPSNAIHEKTRHLITTIYQPPSVSRGNRRRAGATFVARCCHRVCGASSPEGGRPLPRATACRLSPRVAGVAPTKGGASLPMEKGRATRLSA